MKDAVLPETLEKTHTTVLQSNFAKNWIKKKTGSKVMQWYVQKRLMKYKVM